MLRNTCLLAPQYMPSRCRARNQPPGRVPGDRGSVVLFELKNRSENRCDPFCQWCRRRDLNPNGHNPLPPQDSVSTRFHHFGTIGKSTTSSQSHQQGEHSEAVGSFATGAVLPLSSQRRWHPFRTGRQESERLA